MIKKILKLLVYSLIIFSYSSIAQTGIKKIEDISLSPVPTFQDNCSRCHGDEGSAYGKGFGNLRDDSLEQVVEDMMFGPGALDPDTTEIKAMVSYNKSIKGNKPFASVINSKSFLDGKDKSLKISVSPKAEIKLDNNKVKVVSTNGIWSLSYNPKKNKEIKITVTRNKNSSVLNFPDELWTN
jgi:hypothetical protein